MFNADVKRDKIVEQLEQGKTVLFCTPLKVTKVTPRTYKNFRGQGHELFKVKDNSLFIAAGKGWKCVDFCQVRVQG